MWRPAARLTACCSRTIASRGWWPMRSKRKESMRWSRAHTTAESIISRAIMRCSVAVLSQQVERSTSPLPSSRW
jgi:hypothetical protein